MGKLISKGWKKRDAQVVMLGLNFAGKSTLLYKLKSGQAVETCPTVGFNVESLQTPCGISFTLWDVGGQDSLRASWPDYLEDINTLVFVIDSTDTARLSEAAAALEETLSHPSMAGIPVLLLANKQEVPGALAPSELGEMLQRGRLAGHRWMLQGCSAHTGQGLQEVLAVLGELLRDPEPSSLSQEQPITRLAERREAPGQT
ncbi:PREDICTED: ADP-ribosylation factor-like protein 11 [Lepidothrix coronata]|uniref:ADP-ribosylation factor-like protein 11 n=1 Tax=Lepidothrix coronata TaxID=321398 RepID=A0A6J0H8X3_9PASS|nr:PREDICTED: ADP-ribosylation factor-like protein 11 [Lepidothrix coronata]